MLLSFLSLIINITMKYSQYVLSIICFILIINTLIFIYLYWGNIFNIFKGIGKYFTKKNIISGIICIIAIFLIRQSGLSLLILNLVQGFLPNMSFPLHIEDLISSILVLIVRLSAKGMIDELFKDKLTNSSIGVGPCGVYMTGVEPETGNSLGIKSSGLVGSASPGGSSNPPAPAPSSAPAPVPVPASAPVPVPSSSAPVPSSSSSPVNSPVSGSANPSVGVSSSSSGLNTSSSSTGYVKGSYVANRYIQIFSAEAERISSEIKDLSKDIKNCKDDNERIRKEDELDELFGMLSMLDRETAAATRKLLGSVDTENDNKRAAGDDSVQNSSKKR